MNWGALHPVPKGQENNTRVLCKSHSQNTDPEPWGFARRFIIESLDIFSEGQSILLLIFVRTELAMADVEMRRVKRNAGDKVSWVLRQGAALWGIGSTGAFRVISSTTHVHRPFYQSKSKSSTPFRREVGEGFAASIQW
jgi:hypothetical protein